MEEGRRGPDQRQAGLYSSEDSGKKNGSEELEAENRQEQLLLLESHHF